MLNNPLTTTSLKTLIAATIISISSTSLSLASSNLPTNGNVVGGSATITQSNSNTLNINQHSNSAIINWDTFSIGRGNTVNFYQPSSSSVALNRILGNDASQIFGSLNANGHVFITNPNGVIFASGSQVNVGGLVASTKDINLSNFNSNNNINNTTYNFSGNSTNAIINEGNIQVSDNGNLAFIATQITNDGNITAKQGNVLLAAGDAVTLDLGGPVKLEITQGALDTAINQGGVIKADGGYVYLTTKALNDLSTSVINNTGTIQAQTINNKTGKIIIIGDMSVGITNISGKLDASAPTKGDGGFIETSASHVNISPQTLITAASKKGKGGTWLIDPYDYTIDSSNVDSLLMALNNGTSVTLNTTTDGGYGAFLINGTVPTITVYAALDVMPTSAATLTLDVSDSGNHGSYPGNIVINSAISGNSKFTLVLKTKEIGSSITGEDNIAGSKTRSTAAITGGATALIDTYNFGVSASTTSSTSQTAAVTLVQSGQTSTTTTQTNNSSNNTQVTTDSDNNSTSSTSAITSATNNAEMSYNFQSGPLGDIAKLFYLGVLSGIADVNSGSAISNAQFSRGLANVAVVMKMLNYVADFDASDLTNISATLNTDTVSNTKDAVNYLLGGNRNIQYYFTNAVDAFRKSGFISFQKASEVLKTFNDLAQKLKMDANL